MVKIPSSVKSLFEEQGIFVVGSVGETNFCNVSPRIFFIIIENSIYWLDFFKHKSYQNFQANPWVNLAVFDKNNFVGYQLRGKVTFLQDDKKTEKIRNDIIKRTLKTNKSKKAEEISKLHSYVIQFKPSVIYSMIPEKYSNLPITLETDSVKFFSNLHKQKK